MADATFTRLGCQLLDLRRAGRQDDGIGAYGNEGICALAGSVGNNCGEEPHREGGIDYHIVS